jgi:type IV pilus assembly protein PilW
MKTIHAHLDIPGHNRNRGFTLVELMIALVVSGVIVAAIYSTYVAQQRTALAQEQVVEMQQNIRAGLDIMEREIRMAGYNPRRTAIGTGITTANATQLVFGFVADTDQMNNNPVAVNATIDEVDEVETVEYYLYDAYADADMDLGRRTPTNTQAVAENIDAVEFYYIMADGTKTLTPVTLTDIRSVQVSILARASRIDPSFTNSATYTTVSNATWGPYNDNFRRRLLVTTIHCRNMGL